jgi:hypothetical protein
MAVFFMRSIMIADHFVVSGDYSFSAHASFQWIAGRRTTVPSPAARFCQYEKHKEVDD